MPLSLLCLFVSVAVSVSVSVSLSLSLFSRARCFQVDKYPKPWQMLKINYGNAKGKAFNEVQNIYEHVRIQRLELMAILMYK
jgi:hypothetical protein